MVRSLVFRANASTSTRWRPMISTVASDDLREILEEGLSDSVLARRIIKYQLKSYEQYISAPRKFPDHLPSLVDLVADKIKDSTDILDRIPDVILSRHIWAWHKISYAMLRSALNRLSSADSVEPPKKRLKAETTSTDGSNDALKDINEWILIHEKYMGDGERLGDDWQCGLVTFADAEIVFPKSTTTPKARKIQRPKNLPGYTVLDGERRKTIYIQPSVAAFKSTFDRMSNGLLKNLNWDNVVVAGGIVLGALLAVDTPTGKAQAEHWANSDIDVYIHGLTPKKANEKLQHLFATFRANLPAGAPTLVVRNSKTVTFYSRYPLRRIQVVLKLVKYPKAVLLNFDLDICAMGWDGSDLWMLPRTARALETGYNVFTMNLIQGHYLSERRASQEQRVFKYAYKVSPSGLTALPGFADSPPYDRAMGYAYYLHKSRPSRSHKPISTTYPATKNCFDMDAIVESSRAFTETVIEMCKDGQTVSHYDLDNKHQVSSEPQGRSSLSSFSLFMRHVALWDVEQHGHIEINEWASTTYGDFPETILAYDNTPSYTWGEDFKIPDFKHQIDVFNLRQITEWLDADNYFMDKHGLDEDGAEFKAAARLTYGPTVAKILDRAHDVVLPVVLPLNFAVFANSLIGEAQEAAGLKVQHILTPAVKGHAHLVVDPDSLDTADGLFLWRIGKEMMWQQLDRRIDEIFEALYAFYRVNDRPNGGHVEERLITELSRRAIRPIVEDEFEAFARWIGRQPIFVRWFYNHVASFDRMEGQSAQYHDSDSERESSVEYD